MSDLPALLGLGGMFTVAGRGANDPKVTYKWSPLTLGDEADLEMEIRSAIADRLNVVGKVRGMLSGFKGEALKALVVEALREHLRLDRLDGLGLLQEFQSADLEVILFRYHLRQHHPELTNDDVRKLMTSDVVNSVIGEINTQMRSTRLGGSSGTSSSEPSGSSPPTTMETPPPPVAVDAEDRSPGDGMPPSST